MANSPSVGVSLIELHTTSTGNNFIQVYMADAGFPVLGDGLYDYRVRTLLGHKVKFTSAHSVAKRSQILPQSLLQLMGLQRGEEWLHLENWLGKGIHLTVFAPPPKHFTQTCNGLGINMDYKVLANEDTVKCWDKDIMKNRKKTAQNATSMTSPIQPPPSRHPFGGESMSKMLPTVPDMDTQLALSAKMIDKKTSTPKGSHSYGSYFLEYSLMAEFNLLLKQKLPGIYCLPSARSPLLWFGVLFIRQGAYQEGVFRFQVHIPENYPDGDVPKIVFEHSLFHPSIDPVNNELNVKQGFHKWKRNVNHIWQILLYTRRVFYKIDTSNATNPEAALLYEKDIDMFQAKARSCVLDSKEQLYLTKEHEDPHYLIFSAYDQNLHGSARDQLKQGVARALTGDIDGSNGADRRSYIATGSLTIFSEDIMKDSQQSGPKSMPK